MKMQKLVLKNIFKDNRLVILIFILLLLLKLILLLVQPDNISIVDFYSMIAFPTIEYNAQNILFVLFQIIFICYFNFIFYVYEINNSFENTILRINQFKWEFTKIKFILICTLLFKILITSIFLIYFRNVIDFQLNYYSYSIVFQLFLNYLIVFFINFCNYKKITNYLLLSIICLMTFYKFNLIIVTIETIGLVIVNITKFKFKKIYNKK